MPYTSSSGSWKSHGPHVKTVAQHAQYWSALKHFERKFVETKGRNPDMPPWGDHPRRGALWSYEENLALMENFKDQVPENGGALGFKELCEIAHLHGRTATSIEAQLKKVLGWKTFYTYFQ